MAPTIEFSQRETSERRRFRYQAYALIISAAAMCGLARICTVAPLLGANDCSRWCMVAAMVDRGTFQIDEIMSQPGWNTVDHIHKDGHFYSTKPPLMQVFVGGVYFVLKKCTGWMLLSHTPEVVRTILVVVNWLPMVISLILFAWIGERYAETDWARIYLISAAAWGTFLSTFVVTLNNHTLAAFSVLCGTVTLLRILDGSRSPLLFGASGIAAGLAFVFELPAGMFALGVFIILARNSVTKAALCFLPCAAIPVAGHFFTNYLETGGFKPFYAYFGTDYYNYVLNGTPSYWSSPSGIDRGLDSFPVYLFNMTIGHHGILSLTPCFFITIVGWLKDDRRSLSSLHRLTWIQSVVLLDFYLLQTDSYNYGGVTCGLRWMFWLIPLWLIGMIPTLDRWASSRMLRGLATSLLVVSIFSAAWASMNPWVHPWIFSLWERLGWIDYNS